MTSWQEDACSLPHHKAALLAHTAVLLSGSLGWQQTLPQQCLELRWGKDLPANFPCDSTELESQSSKQHEDLDPRDSWD